MSEPILEVSNLVKEFAVSGSKGIRKTRAIVHAVSGVSFTVNAGQTVGLVGESGSGKTTVGRTILRLAEPTSGSIKFKGREIVGMPRSEMRKLRREMQIVFQDPQASLDPRLTVGSAIAEPLRIQKVKGNHQEKVQELLELVGLAPDHARRFPHEFSGGQRQRIGIARALALDPSLVVLDEPVSALDVSVQGAVVNLLDDLQDRLGLSYLFIAHDLSVVRHISDVMAVMYLGKIMEIADRDTLYESPRHPYTKALLSAVPVPDPAFTSKVERIRLQGDLPSPANPPSGCVFRTRCWKVQEQCSVEVPPVVELEPGHQVACHFPEPKSEAVSFIPTQDDPSGE